VLGNDGAPLLAAGGSIVSTSGMATARRLPAGRIGRTKEIADAIIDLLRNGFITGTGGQGRP
jgi:hypothetical protein